MNTIARLDRMIVRLVYVRNLLTKHGHEVDIPLDLHPAEAETTALYEAAVSLSEDLSNDNARN